jgi:amino acid permease
MMWHTNAVAVARELERPTFDRCFLVSFGGSAGIAMIYGLSAFVGYVSWGSATKASIVDMYPKDDLVFTVIRLMLTASLCVTAPMNMYPVRESCVSLIRVARPDFEHTHTVRAVLGALLIFGAAGVAIIYPQVLAIMSLLGGVFATWLMIVFPAWISKLLLPRRSWNVVMVIAALLAVFLTLAALNVIGDEIPA